MDSPNPIPPGDDPVLNGSKTTCSSPGGSPPPSSATSKRQLVGPALHHVRHAVKQRAALEARSPAP
jgi:hypothetical protein